MSDSPALVPPPPSPRPSAFVVDERPGGTRPEAEPAAPGRPHGTKASVFDARGALRHHHFAYVRFIIEGISLRQAWQRCLAFSGGTDDRRHFARRLREISAQIRAGAEARQLAGVADTALQGLEQHWCPDPPTSPASSAEPPAGAAVPVPAEPVPVVPTLDEWVEERCAAQGIDVDFQTQAEWLQEYLAEFNLDGHGGPAEAAWPAPATALAQRGPDGEASRPHDAELASSRVGLNEQLDALNRLATWLAVPPALTDRTDAWLAPAICERLREIGVITLANLADFVDVHGHRWHRRVRALGAVRATRLLDWLSPLLEQLARPLRDTALKPAHYLALSRQRQLVRLDPMRLLRFGVVPLERLAVPPELSGRQGTFRVHGPNVLNVDDDLAAIRAWLQRYSGSPRTYRSYFHAAEVFYLWCVWVRRKSLASLVEADLHAFRSFIAAPPADWINPRQADRASDGWRPLRGPLSPQSQRHVFTVVGALYAALHDAGYVSANPVSGVKPHLKLARARINVRRSFSEAQWRCVLATLADLPNTPATRRTRLVLELGATTGLRLIEICTARLGGLGQERDEDGAQVWMLTLVGKGAREREVVIFDDVKAMLDQHQLDMQAAGIGFDAAAPLRTLARADDDGASPRELGASLFAVSESVSVSESEAVIKPDPALRPLVGALRRPVPRWRLDENGIAVLDRTPRQSDAYGALEPSALYQTLKRLFARAAQRAPFLDPPLDPSVFSKASTHWLRHFFANNAIEDGIEPTVVGAGMGHADLKTTSIYVNPERRALMKGMAKMRRRG